MVENQRQSYLEKLSRLTFNVKEDKLVKASEETCVLCLR